MNDLFNFIKINSKELTNDYSIKLSLGKFTDKSRNILDIAFTPEMIKQFLGKINCTELTYTVVKQKIYYHKYLEYCIQSDSNDITNLYNNHIKIDNISLGKLDVRAKLIHTNILPIHLFPNLFTYDKTVSQSNIILNYKNLFKILIIREKTEPQNKDTLSDIDSNIETINRIEIILNYQNLKTNILLENLEIVLLNLQDLR